MKKTVHIISHSHWDREWYMPYEQHHMRLIHLMDDLLDLFAHDKNFKSFHLDGQTIILDDYLEVRPQRKAEVKAAIQAGKLKIGPFYILQDDFLISSESNVRNMLIGAQESAKWGQPVKLGYFPDTFGNMGQTPQLMKKAGLDAAAFGRGVKPIGFDNQVLPDENYTSNYSEMKWVGPDNTEIFGLLFANWYSNGNEIPVDEEEAFAYWTRKLAEVTRYASTDQLLMMNGVDHQPVQKDIGQAIEVANRLFPEYEFIHSNFDDYLDAVKAQAPEDLATVKGELTSQETDGWYTLANTASTRVYLKQENTRVERLLENQAEVLASIASEISGDYPHDQLTYAWKTLLQNHPHDSICGCSVDAVHREMMTRFAKASEVGEFVAQESLEKIGKAVDTTKFPQDSWPFIFYNTTGQTKSDLAEVIVQLENRTFSQGRPPALYQELLAEAEDVFMVIDENGNEIPAEISQAKVGFNYLLPQDRFRIPMMEKTIQVKLLVKDVAPFSFKTYALVLKKNVDESEIPEVIKKSFIKEDGHVLENELVKVTIAENGSVTYQDKATGRTLKDLAVYEDYGDVGNEYIFRHLPDEEPILSSSEKAKVEIISDEDFLAEVMVTQTLLIPISAVESLATEQQMVLDFNQRTDGRSPQVMALDIHTKISLPENSRRLSFTTTLNNQMKDHRLRVLFPTEFQTETHEADSIFEVVTRPNKVSKSWLNPANPQHQQVFCNIHDQSGGLTMSNFGLNEYEILNSNTIALTLLRCVGEMGDWGYFPTPEAQCLGEHIFHFAVEFHETPTDRYATYLNSYASQVPFSTQQVKPQQDGILKSEQSFINVKGDMTAVTAVKRRADDNTLVVRAFNLAPDMADFTLEKGQDSGVLLNLLEESTDQVVPKKMAPYEILTVGFEGGK
ncbi:alpha-mannosidase [Enterococcus timonensis]|uniref:alpha-mannosidase n=1 Tax=Enterococcus timonensis TaxID=1852364 RepID=UPI0008D9DE0E|nr:alpha-mannosidase [Enterococcus timonensis]